jgi:hypothetical protein
MNLGWGITWAIIGVRSADIALNIILARHCDPGRLLTVLTSEALT